MTDSNEEKPRRTWRKKQPTAAQMRATIAAGEARIRELEGTVRDLLAPPSKPWWRRLLQGNRA